YDHLAGEVGVRIYESLMQRRALVPAVDGLELTAEGQRLFQKLRIDTGALAKEKRAFCRACLDWSERRHHLAGALGAALLARVVELGWAKRARNSRVVLLTANGEQALHKMF
ncbi:MAG TPA: transcriptional regulator, partial [Burkholderiales bacterium]|nr:transcriptional regulator [Burkholderiales bacterium]